VSAPPPPPVALVAFDLDDTLFAERAFVRSGFRAVSDYLLAAGIARQPLAGALEAAFEAGIRGRTFDHVLGEAGIEPAPDLIERLVRVYRTHRWPGGGRRPDIRLYPDADRALARLRAEGARLGLISDGAVEAQQTKVEALGLAARLDAIILTGAWGPEFSKPHPRAFRDLAARLAVEPAACVYVADNPRKDFGGPVRAGWRPSVRIRRPDGFHRGVPLPPDAAVAATVETLDDLPRVLGGR
jgi:putative hydrolase of the HAD superfamily